MSKSTRVRLTGGHGSTPLVAAVLLLCTQVASATPPRVVAELFTSLGCSSCPPADALAGRLSTNSAVLVLSYHVTYWDSPEFTDPFASKPSTDRQYAYQRTLGERAVFTPQLIVNGTQSLVGSEAVEVQHAVAAAAAPAATFPVQTDLSKQPDGSFSLRLSGPDIKADVWELHYVRHSTTRIHGGENGGHTLDTYNNVTDIRRVGSFKPGTLTFPPLKSAADGLAIVVQSPGLGKVLGAAAY
ncbi:MAG TPA: DUF1223 domain-containing protein [Steroidobacteraceae bacterium]